MKALSRLLTVKQLKGMDGVVEEGVLGRVEAGLGRGVKGIEGKGKGRGEQGRGIEGDRKERGGKEEVGLEEVGRIASILSQLNVNGKAIETCQRIFAHYL